MNSVEFTVNEKTYEMRLNTRNLIKLERNLKKNPLSIFLGIEKNELPTLEEVTAVLFYSLQANHGESFRTIDDAYDLYDKYIEEGGSLIELIPVLIEIYQVSGIIPKDTDIDVAKN